MKTSKLSYFFLVLAGVIAISAVVLLILGPKKNSPKVSSQSTTQAPKGSLKTDEVITPGDLENSAKRPKNVGGEYSTTDPAELVAQVGKALESGDLELISRFMGKDALDPSTLERLKALSAGSIKIRQPDGIREVGEVELNVRSRWSLELEGKEAGRNRIYLDLRRVTGKWKVEKLTLPPASDEPNAKVAFADSLGAADAFLQAVLTQHFGAARAFVDSEKVSDTKIAGLCILFEEGDYRMRKSKSLRAMFHRPDTDGYLAYVESADGKQSAQFSLTLSHSPQSGSWLVSEINLNQLLADYASRVAGGDLYYTPFVKNPAGGDTLALYFAFDEDDMNVRTRRQLEIVRQILRADPGKKITLSGYTDALGTRDYNDQLSSRRANVVRDYLIKAGISPSQIVTIAKGDSQPRRPNVTASGQDNPEGRRANRRTEIYLDF
jgi:OOP family OmpA-OmpF porin